MNAPLLRGLALLLCCRQDLLQKLQTRRANTWPEMAANETKRNETKRNETKRNETKRNETKRNDQGVAGSAS
jgi:hypothetical protein